MVHDAPLLARPSPQRAPYGMQCGTSGLDGCQQGLGVKTLELWGGGQGARQPRQMFTYCHNSPL